MNRRGVLTQRGNTWSKSSLHSILRNQTYLGRRVWNREENSLRGVKWKDREQWIIVEGAHEALVSDELFEQVQRRLEEKRANRTPKYDDSPYLLSGMIKCGQCGARYAIHRTGRKGMFSYYRCGMRRRHDKDVCQG